MSKLNTFVVYATHLFVCTALIMSYNSSNFDRNRNSNLR